MNGELKYHELTFNQNRIEIRMNKEKKKMFLITR